MILNEIYTAKKQIVQLAAKWLEAIREGEKEKAMQIRRKCNSIKQNIQKKYNISI